jgi:hypothetical protein
MTHAAPQTAAAEAEDLKSAEKDGTRSRSPAPDTRDPVLPPGRTESAESNQRIGSDISANFRGGAGSHKAS